MSTTGKISQFTSAQEEDVSLRILTGELSLIQPFTDLGFDTLAHKIALDEGKDMADLAGPDYFVHFGRPLYVLYPPQISLTDNGVIQICIIIRCW